MQPDRRMEGFRDYIEQCGLRDLGFVGHNFTWSNKQAGDRNIQEWLDRSLATDGWIERFPRARVTHLTCLLSDHCPLFLETKVLAGR